MNLYELLVFIHIAAAVALVGSSVMASPAVRAAARRARTTEEMRAYLAIGRPLLVIEPAAALTVLATGIYLTSVANFWTQGWVQVAVACWLLNSILAGVMVKPAMSASPRSRPLRTVRSETTSTRSDGPADGHSAVMR